MTTKKELELFEWMKQEYPDFIEQCKKEFKEAF